MNNKRFLRSICSLAIVISIVTSPFPGNDKNVMAAGININNSFPDTAFRNYIINNIDDGDGVLSTSERNKTTDLNVSNLGITDLSGIEYFTYLRYLNCDSNNLETLDVSSNTNLEQLGCGSNSINTLTLGDNPNLIEVWCYDNSLTTLDISGCENLYVLSCYDNSITNIDATNNRYIWDCYYNGETSEPISGMRRYEAGNNPSWRYSLSCDAEVTVSVASSSFTDTDGIVINSAYFPDAAFRVWIFENCDVEHDGNLSYEELDSVTSMDIRNNTDVISLEGIEYFSSLTSLDCSGAYSLTSLNLRTLTSLEYLNCVNFNITSIDVSGLSSLKELNCSCPQASYNSLASLNLDGCASLETLNCSDTSLTELDVSDCVSLVTLKCSRTKVESLDLSGLSNLITLECTGFGGGQYALSSLTLTGCTSLETIKCNAMHLTSLDVSNLPSLKYLDCSINDITMLTLGEIPTLTYLECTSNPMDTLDVSGCENLSYLRCWLSNLEYLDIRNCPLLDQAVAHGTSGGGYNYIYNGNRIAYNSSVTTLIYNDDHIVVIDEAVDPTETEAGLTEGSHCSGCGLVLVAQEVIPALNSNGILIDQNVMPDSVLRDYVLSNYDTNSDGRLSDSEIRMVTFFLIPAEVRDTTGLGVFTSAEQIYNNSNSLEILDLSGCSSLHNLQVSCANLSVINLEGCDTLLNLYIYDNKLQDLDVSSCHSLRNLDCYSSCLETLDISGCPYLIELVESNNSSATSGYYYGTNSSLRVNPNTVIVTSHVSGISLDCDSISLTVGGAPIALRATIAPEGVMNQNVIWSSDNESVATVSDAGVVTPISTGTATITVTTVDGGLTAACVVEVVASTPIDPVINGHGMSLADEIRVRFRVAFPEGFDATGCYMQFTSSSGRTGMMAFADSVPGTNVNERYFSFNINALEIADNISATLYYGDGQTITDSYSAMTYINYVQEHYADYPNGTSLLNLVNALHDYGYYLQQSGWSDGRSHTSIEAPVNNLSDVDIEASRDAVSSYNRLVELDGSGVNESIKVALALTSRTQIRVSVRLEDGVTITSPDYTTRTIDGYTYYMFSIDNIGPKNLDMDYTINISTNQGTATITVSALYYLNVMLNSGTLNNIQLLALTAYYNYYYAVEQY